MGKQYLCQPIFDDPFCADELKLARRAGYLSFKVVRKPERFDDLLKKILPMALNEKSIESYRYHYTSLDSGFRPTMEDISLAPRLAFQRRTMMAIEDFTGLPPGAKFDSLNELAPTLTTEEYLFKSLFYPVTLVSNIFATNSLRALEV
jgi:hypothetical protein